MIKLIASDMDGTLLNDRKELPSGFHEAIRTLKAQGTLFAVASGRQYASLRRDFEEYVSDILFIAENGALVMREDQRLLVDPMDAEYLPSIIRVARTIQGVYPVICRPDCALVEKDASPSFIEDVKRYYPSWKVVDRLEDWCALDDVCKIAFYDEGDAKTHEFPLLQEALSERLCVVLSGQQWVDIMKPGVHKGKAMEGLQRMLGVRPEECMAFGDYLNDYELLESVGESYAMENALDALKGIAKYIAPSNNDEGVMKVLRERFAL